MIDDPLITEDEAKSIWAELKMIADKKRYPDFIVVCAFLEIKYDLLNCRNVKDYEHYIDVCYKTVYSKIS